MMAQKNETGDSIVYGLANEAYHALDALGSTGLRHLAKSPAHFYGKCVDLRRPINKPTPAMLAGTRAHCMLLEPAEFLNRYVVKPEGLDLRTKDGKAWQAMTEEFVPPREVITEQERLTADRQAASILRLPDIAKLIEKGRTEVSAFWTDPDTGVECKCRPDLVAPAGKGVILVDVKTASSAAPDHFPRSIANYGYHLQDAWYSIGYERAAGLPVLGFVFVVVEADYPHAAAAYMIEESVREQAAAENRRLLELYARCKAANDWPGYSQSIQLVTLPPWATIGPESTE